RRAGRSRLVILITGEGCRHIIGVHVDRRALRPVIGEGQGRREYVAAAAYTVSKACRRMRVAVISDGAAWYRYTDGCGGLPYRDSGRSAAASHVVSRFGN